MLIPLLVVFAVGATILVVEIVQLVAEPIDATNEYLAAVRAHDYGAAYAHTCTYGNAVPSLRDFTAEQRALDRRAGELGSYDITLSSIQDRTATTSGTWVRGGRERDVRFHLRQEGDDWKVCTPDGL